MTLTRYPEGMQKSGSTGGTVHSHCRYGSYTKSKSRPVNPNTTRQSKTRAVIGKLAEEWKNLLTLSQRLSWDEYAANVPWKNKLGQTVHLTGFAHFTRSNAARLDCRIDQVNNAPSIFNLATPEQELGTDATEWMNHLYIYFENVNADWLMETGAYQLVYIGRPISSGHKYYGGPWTYVNFLPGNPIAPPGSPRVLTLPGIYKGGATYRVRTRISRADGRLSEWSYATGTVL